MRSVSAETSVRLYHLDDEGGTTTLLYGTLGEAIARASAESEDVQAGLYLQTDNDVIAWGDFAGG